MSGSARRPRSGNRNRRGLTPRQQRFAEEYLVDLNGKAAAERAGYSAKTARHTALELLALPWVQQLIAEGMAARARRTALDADAVVKRLWDITTADPRELVDVRRTCCRYCYGQGFRYQRTAAELEQAREEFEAGLRKNDTRVFNEQGGAGYNPTRDPHPDCPECWGEGVERVRVRDQRRLTAPALALLASTKVTREGIEVKLHNQVETLIAVGRHLGLFLDKPAGPPDPSEVARTVRTALEAMDATVSGAA